MLIKYCNVINISKKMQLQHKLTTVSLVVNIELRTNNNNNKIFIVFFFTREDDEDDGAAAAVVVVVECNELMGSACK